MTEFNIKINFLPIVDDEDDKIPIEHIEPCYPQCIPDRVILDNKTKNDQSDYLVQFLS